MDTMQAQQAEAQRALLVVVRHRRVPSQVPHVTSFASCASQEAQEHEALADFASPAGRAASFPSDGVAGNASAEQAPRATAATNSNRGPDALASLLPNAPPSPIGERLLSPHSVKPVSRASTLSGARASLRTPSLLRRETAVTTARGAYFSQVWNESESLCLFILSLSLPLLIAATRGCIRGA